MDDLDISHDPASARFVAAHHGADIGVVDYRLDRVGAVLSVLSTRTEPAVRGQGIAADLTRAVLDYAAANELRVRPVCPYTAAFFDRHPEYAALRA